MSRPASFAVWGVALFAIGGALAATLVDDIPSFTHTAGERPDNDLPLTSKRTLGQTVRPPAPNLSAVDVRFRGPPGELVGDVTLRVRRSPTAAEDLRVTRLTVGKTRRDTPSRFRFSPLETNGEETVFILLEYPTGRQENPLTVRAERPAAPPSPDRWVDYPDGSLYDNGVVVEGDLAFTLLTSGRRPFGMQLASAALLAGGSLLLAAAAARWARAPLTKVRVAGAFVAIGLPVVFFLPLLIHPTFQGGGDWDMNTTLLASAEHALNAERAFPSWNPYLCGGTPLSAFPEAPIFSPFFATVLLGGPVMGYKINILLHGIAGFLGMLVWLRLGFRSSWTASFLGAAVFLFSSFLALHLFAGHSRKIAYAWIPWVLFFFHRALEPRDGSAARHRSLSALRWCAPAAATLALMFLDGSVYLSLYTALAVAVAGCVLALSRRSGQPLVAAALLIALGGGLAGVHVIPSLLSQRQLKPDLRSVTVLPPIRTLVDVFVDPLQEPYAQKFDGQPLPWYEYGAYVGIVPVLLAGAGIVGSPRRLLPWISAAVVPALGAFSQPVQQILITLPVFGSLRTTPRLVALVPIAVAVSAAVGFDRIRDLLVPNTETALGRAATTALRLLAAMVIGHLLFVNTETLATTFTVPPPRESRSAIDVSRPFQQGWASPRRVGTEDSYPVTFLNTIQNMGSVNRCSVASVKPSGEIRLPPEHAPDGASREFLDVPYSGEAFFTDGSGSVTMVRQQTSRASLRYERARPGVVALNQNYHQGWTATLESAGGGQSPLPVTAWNGLAAVSVPAGSGTVLFAYRTPFLGLSLTVTVLSIAFALALWRSGLRALSRNVPALTRGNATGTLHHL